MSNPIDFATVFAEIQERQLNAESVEKSFDAILSGAWNPYQVAGFLTALRVSGESATTLSAAARAMRSKMVAVKAPSGIVLDTCGTGGDGSGTVNLSTAAAILCAAEGVVVAKHGNRAVSSSAGSADVLAALEIPTDLPADKSAALLGSVGIAFMLAPVHHPAMRHVMPVRKELGVRTIFNCLGPLANPAGATHQLIGAFSDELRPLLAHTLNELGTRRAWVVRGVDGLDEVSPYGETRVSQVHAGAVTEFTVTPPDFGLATSPEGAATGGDAATNAGIIEAVFRDEAHPARDAIVLNAAASLVIALELEPRAATERIAACISSGRALNKLEAWRTAARDLAS